MKLKLCGVRTTEMLRACQGGQVDFVGLNFVPDSKRRVLRLPDLGSGNRFKLVGVFRDPSVNYVCQMVKEANLDVVQLHGSETPAFMAELAEKLPEMSLWKALSTDEGLDEKLLQEYCKKSDLILFDGKTPGSGNNILDHENLNDAIFVAKQAGAKVGIAGGINADNIHEFKANFPKVFLLDTASGIELNGDFSITETQRLIQNFDA